MIMDDGLWCTEHGRRSLSESRRGPQAGYLSAVLHVLVVLFPKNLTGPALNYDKEDEN